MNTQYKPKLKTCPRCDGKRWFPSAVGEIACQECDATGRSGIDIDWLIKDWQRLKAMESQSGQPEWLSEALNSGNGTYKP